MPLRWTYNCDDWAGFERGLNAYFARPADRRAQWAFRGEANTKRLLSASVDRDRNFKDAKDREALLKRYLLEFKRQATGLQFSQGFPEKPKEWELLARHHGLPSAVLDWTSSPYFAAYFAYADPASKDAEAVAVWAFDRAYFESDAPANKTPKDDPVEIWDDYDDLRVNTRAVEQASVFMRVNQPSPPLEEALKSHLAKFVLPSSIRAESLCRLAAMGITARRLFRDLDHAAETARWQVEDSQP